MGNPQVSIIIPVYNVERYLRRCVESILNQSLSNLELIMIDDFSTDGSLNIAEEYEKKDRRVHVLHNEENLGPMISRETGYLRAQGDFVTFCDADDALPLDSIEILYNNAINTKSDIVFGYMRYIDVSGKQEDMIRSPFRQAGRIEFYESMLSGSTPHSLCAKLFKRELLHDHNYQNFPHFTNGEDGLLLYQVVANVNKVTYVDMPVYNYYQNWQSSTQKRFSDNAIRNIVCFNKFKETLCGKYQELEITLFRTISTIFRNLIEEEYGVSVRKYVMEFDMERYLSLKEMHKYLSIFEYLKVLIKRLT